MRPFLLLGAGALVVVGVGACDQDYAASNADRHSFMDDIHAAPLPSASAPQTLPPPAMPPATAALTPAPSASTTPASSASGASAPSATPAPAGPGKH
jgi:hypothetical protein